MATQKRIFYCLRCQQRFPVDYNPKEVAERSCPKCGSNSVRIETATAAARGNPQEVQSSGG